MFCRLLIFFKVSNSYDPDQAQLFVRPDLGPNCLQRLSADATSKQRVKVGKVFEKVKCFQTIKYTIWNYFIYNIHSFMCKKRDNFLQLLRVKQDFKVLLVSYNK